MFDIKKQESFVVVDLETTGFSHHTENVIEVAGIKIKNNKIIDTFESLIYVDYIPYYLTKNVHGIDTSMVKDAPPLHLVRSKFCEFIKGCILVGHNIKNFDSKFLYKHFKLSKDTQYIDTLDMSRILFSNERCHNLEAVSKRLGIKRNVCHRAFEDAKVTAKVFIKLLKLNNNYKFIGDTFQRETREVGVNKKAWQYTKMDKQVVVRVKKLGDLGELLTSSLLRKNGFKKVKNLNKTFSNTPLFDFYAEKGKHKYAISVKTRNEYENSVAGRRLNSRYTLTKNPKQDEDTARVKYNSEAAWIAIPVDIDRGVFSAYFGTLSILSGNKKGIIMSLDAKNEYECLASDERFENHGISKKEYSCLKNEYNR